MFSFDLVQVKVQLISISDPHLLDREKEIAKLFKLASRQLIQVDKMITTREINLRINNFSSGCLIATDFFLVSTLICLVIEGIILIKDCKNKTILKDQVILL